MSQVGFFVFVVGIAIAISGGAKMPTTGDWPDTVPLFLVGCAITILGLVIWRKALAAAHVVHSAESEKQDAMALLAALMGPAKKLGSEIDSLDVETINSRADDLIETYVLPFAEDRKSILQEFGMDLGADVLCTMAFGERMLNRVWSASADGHVQEARACFPEALAAFELAQAKLSS